MGKRGIILTAMIIFLVITGFLIYYNFEIYPRKRYISPSREVSVNIYYAMEKWLKETGHNVNVMEYFHPNMLEKIQEKVAVVISGKIFWDEAEKILPWIEQGGFLVIAAEQENENCNLLKFLSDMGITIEYDRQPQDEDVRQTARAGEPELIPDFYTQISFLIDNDEKYFTIKDHSGKIRLAEISAGKGAITVTGDTVFMYNYNLEKEANAVLSWRLTGGRTYENNKDILFIREQIGMRNSMFGAIMERGNLVPVITSSFILIILGFWMVIPVFGLVSAEKQFTARPLKDRFTAEISFLKKYGALNHYLHVFEREQKYISNEREISKKEKIYNYQELINQYRRMFDGTPKF